MRRLLAALATVAAVAAPAHAAPYAGQVRETAATFRLRGVDGHLFTLALATRTSGLGGTSTMRDLTLVLTECAGSRCTTKRYVTALSEERYSESTDLSLTFAGATIGGLALQVGWSSAAGYGHLPPAAATTDGAALTSAREATAVLLAGTVIGDGVRWIARCEDRAARVRSSVGVFTAEQPKGAWPAQPPAGLKVKKFSTHVFTCAGR